MKAYWPDLKRGNPYRQTLPFSFTSGSLLATHAILAIKENFAASDAQAKILAVTPGLFTDYPWYEALLPNAIEALTLADGSGPSTGVLTIDIPPEYTAPLRLRPHVAGVQLVLPPTGEPYELPDDVLDHELRVFGDVIRATVEP